MASKGGFPSVAKGNKVAEPATVPRAGIPLKHDQIAPLLKHYHGNISRAADKLGCSRHALRRVIDKSPELMLALADCRERFVDNLEQCAWHKALDGDSMLQMFLLKTIGRQRGYNLESATDAAHGVARAAFDFVLNKSKSPVIQGNGLAIEPRLELMDEQDPSQHS